MNSEVRFYCDFCKTNTHSNTSCPYMLEYYETALDFIVGAVENGEIETDLPKNSRGKGGYSISNDTTIRLAMLLYKGAHAL